MAENNLTETHYILIGSNRYQILFDSSIYDYDILIRGKFTWDKEVPSKVNKIDITIDNLSPIMVPYEVTKANWCSKQNRLELHLNIKENGEMRTHANVTLTSEFDFAQNDHLELALRIYSGDEPHEDCGDYTIQPPNEYKFNVERVQGKTQDDKDGSILIGTTILRP